ncbi:nucleoside-diphosphate sugar epimerase/dehydratase [Rubinisphaera sp.]|uniref:polysaccharide biosynthesis protein n=1 Tax=Rubinisphaera sp. TaxID=2024857 RepID=UPI000C0DF3B0|nr:nucleoside-diphosphate sugar epimerase/dehydratase [Rubinisphaera sp.]MBV09802.1 capsule biosynthesis protein CapD [Rubinisphaera sp.]HCS54829.1 polysaccharide biosynthesis protein [Planctomycetaceae bacterium]|tara:strand:- start:306 stop:2168 length:1863 start_codon:yes stop_codon:yes gene_type:complete
MRHRLAIILPIYTILITASLFFAFCLRFDFTLGNAEWARFAGALPFVIAAKLAIAAITREWNRSYRHVSISDGVIISGACGFMTSLLLAMHYLIPQSPMTLPRSVTLIDGLISLLAMLGFRIACRIIWARRNSTNRNQPTETALIFGSDESAIGIWKMVMSSNGQLGRYRIVGFINSSGERQNSLIGGQQVYSLEDCWESKTATPIQHILVPTSTSGRVIRDLLNRCQEADIQLHKIPTVEEIVEGRFRLAVRELDIDDLLRRPPTKLDLDKIGQSITGKTVLVTGGAGSIGSELCRQIMGFKPSKLILFDHSEFGVFKMEREFASRDFGNIELCYLTGSILDSDALEGAFARHQPEIVFHAAAYKHVPLMQDNPYAAIRNNFMGTKALVDTSHKHNVERFVLISTDKAVRPTSVMGATKLLAEKYLQAMSEISSTKFITVRFGNVLNSVGSVVPTFRKQIELGGPVTVTHKDMVRYFMTIPEAVQLVLQAGAVGSSGNVLILDMGEPVKIVDLAKDMISLSGLSYPDDIDINFTGLRPGEKMYEELFYENEQSAPKIHEKIILGAGYAPSTMQINSDLQQLEGSLNESPEELAKTLWQVVNRYVALDDVQSDSRSRSAA